MSAGVRNDPWSEQVQSIAEETLNAELVYATGQHNVLLTEYLRTSGVPATIRTDVHRADEMFAYALDVCQNSWNDALVLYHNGGLSAWRTVRDILARGAVSPQRWLDFGCGYGRVLRFARAEQPEVEIVGSDIDPRAVDYVGRRFGVEGLVSSHDPDSFSAPNGFSLVTAHSVFTHLPEATFGPWLAKLWDSVAQGGVLAVSTNSMEHRPRHLGEQNSEFVFERHSESDDLSRDLYGTTWISHGWMQRTCDARLADLASVSRLGRGLWNAQDLWLLGKASATQTDAIASARAVPWTPSIGYVEGVLLVSPKSVRVEGWCLGPESGCEHGAGAVDTGQLSVEIAIVAASGERLSTLVPGDLRWRDDLGLAYGDSRQGGSWSVLHELAEPVRGTEILAVIANGWPVHFSFLDGADSRVRTERKLHELQAGQRILKDELERRGGLPLRLARSVLRRLAARRHQSPSR